MQVSVQSVARKFDNCLGRRETMFCSKCGKELDGNEKFCPNCGFTLSDAVNKGNNTNGYEKKKTESVPKEEGFDQYEQSLIDKARKEKIGNIITFSIVGVLCVVLFVNNTGYRDTMEILIMCALTSFFVIAVYGVIAAVMGIYGASKYLDKYRQMKREIGKTEAVKMIEQSFHPEEGFGMMKGGVNAAGGCAGGCFSSIVGFAVTIIAIVLLMALC